MNKLIILLATLAVCRAANLYKRAERMSYDDTGDTPPPTQTTQAPPPPTTTTQAPPPPTDGGSGGTGGTGPGPLPVGPSGICGYQHPSKVPSTKRKMGETEEEMFARIVGGNAVDPGEYPWQVAMMKNGQQWCGATFIGKEWILTAAHCFLTDDQKNTDTNVTPWKMRLGEHHLLEQTVVEYEGKPAKIILHPKYTPSSHMYDIALVKLTQAIPEKNIGDYINTPCIAPPKDNSFPVGTMCTVTGWGATSYGGSSSHVLLEVDINIHGNDKCPGSDPASMICAGILAGGKDSCQGDSGGPMVCKKDNRYYIVGVVSYGEQCALKDKPGVYTNVNHYLKWIQDTVATK